MFYITLIKDVALAWSKENSKDYDRWFYSFSINPKNSGYFGHKNKLVQNKEKARLFLTEDEAEQALENTKFNDEIWSAEINPVTW